MADIFASLLDLNLIKVSLLDLIFSKHNLLKQAFFA